MPMQSLFERRDAGTPPILGELVFGKFVERGPPEGPPPAVFAAPELDQAVVDDFFVNDDAPMFGLDDETAWPALEPLFGDSPSVGGCDVEEALKHVEEVGVRPAPPLPPSAEPSTRVESELFSPPLPTPSVEELELPEAATARAKRGGGEMADSSGVVSYKRKCRNSPLTPVVCKSGDPVAVKRARNTEAARRSRARKLMRMNQLEEKVEELLERNQELESEVTKLRARLAEALPPV